MQNLRFVEERLFSILTALSKQYKNLVKKHDLGYCIYEKYMCVFEFQETRSGNLSVKGQIVHSLGFVVVCGLCHNSAGLPLSCERKHRHYIDRWVWLCTSKTL